jgi:hypothetical protein
LRPSAAASPPPPPPPRDPLSPAAPLRLPLQVPPVFAIKGLPKTPEEGDKYSHGPGSATTRQELHALFDVIGTPAWACIEGVQSAAWRSYLLKIRGKAPTLYRWARARAVELGAGRLAAWGGAGAPGA